MKSFIAHIAIALLFLHGIHGQSWTMEKLNIIENFDVLETHFAVEDDSIHVINFWATWCKPCVAELPYLEETRELLKDENIKFSYVSLDFPRQLEKKLIPFLNKNNLGGNIVVLTDGDFNSWIDRVDPSWSGAIPMTIIMKGDAKSVYEQSFHSTQEILEIINSIK